MSYGMLIDLNRCLGCGACAMACKQEHATRANIHYCRVVNGEVGAYPDAHMVSIPYACMQCVNPQCVEVCSTGATYRDIETGIVLIDYDRCDGCGACGEACPYDVRQFNLEEDDGDGRYWGPGFDPTAFEAECSANHQGGVAQKCQWCHERVAEGRDPACVETCIVGARIFGEIDDDGSELSRAIAEHGATQLWADAGTAPAVYYVGDLSLLGETPDEQR